MSGRVDATGAIGKAFRVLELISANPRAMNFKSLQAATEYSPPTLYRILQTAEHHGLIRVDPTSRCYTPGFQIAAAAQRASDAGDLASLAASELKRLRDITGETVYLSVRKGERLVNIGKFESPHSDRSSTELGTPRPLHCTSQGKALLAFLPVRSQNALFKRMSFERFTASTITEVAVMKHELAEVRRRGFSVDDEEFSAGVRSIGAPILNEAGIPIGALCVSGPSYRVSPDRVIKLANEVTRTASDIQLFLQDQRTPIVNGEPLSLSSFDGFSFYGASPVYLPYEDTVAWVDRFAPAVHITGNEGTATLRLDHPERIRTLVASEQVLLVMTESRAIRISDNVVVDDSPAGALRDMSAFCVRPDGALFALKPCGSTSASVVGLVREDGGFEEMWRLTVSVSSIVWSPDGKRIYALSQETGTIFALENGGAAVRIFSRLSNASGQPAAAACDADGLLWVAMYDGWGVVRLNAVGEVERLIPIPTPRPTGLVFSGRDLQTLVITSARIGLDRDALLHAPEAGRLFSFQAGVRGAVAPRASSLPA